MEDLDAVVIGAGVVGLATARALALAGRDVVILEKADAFGTGTSSRNSEVIHAGLYYAPGWIKAQVCVAGRRRLYAYCGERGIPHRRCGKLVVATNATQAAMLDGIAAQARGHGVEELEILSGAAATAMEPQLSCIAALHSPVTGIVDSHALMLSLLGDAEAAGAILCVRTPVRHLAYEGGRIVLTCGDGDAAFTATARTLINAAGLGAPALAARLWGEGAAIPCPRGRMAKGNYFSLTGRAPFTRLVYPVPEPGGLGVHITVDLGGRARFGPDVEWVETETYAVDPARGEAFYGAIRRYWPALPDGALAPDTSGIRPKIVGPGEANADFLIADTAVHGVPGAIHLLGIESPGLTSCLALADLIAAKAG